jgi:hypothetical protein
VKQIQDEFFADNVRSVHPPNFPYFGYAESKSAVRKKGEDFVKRIEPVHRAYTTEPFVSGSRKGERYYGAGFRKNTNQ